ncbi:hypothetical protein [Rosenbergiella nectarea]|uniref:hypothetical protein n=1 Tax=Rosenbergiella nectarea TaxID=988801 RepID=UPI001F4EBC75|nr:hypothetical protein [Rosenbergiella nectarea]
MESLELVASSIWHHFSIMTPFILTITLIKFSLPIIYYIGNRIFEYKTVKDLMRDCGFSEEEAKATAKRIWRKPLPKWLKKIIPTIRKNQRR